eukprot:CAMPEP_0203766062 /NCGR_PEP_ID=MMETSP0099_2-20121227/205_1 /ASSEMBLY_ACC=CAM_ASM_000209 /TAXON_ID=96639 /ORGANISM=" , Strain NY0313808BC1" /LENGTH=143 /DNA_ID=CAMNT_0050662363 /DNA_START=100 /DNA_END=531 /DNA_ORIENTATION=-
MKKPLWYDICKAAPPMVYAPEERMHYKLDYPEERLYTAYYRKNPAAKASEVIDLHDQEFKAPATLFVKRQLELMEKQGMTEDQAYEQTQSEMKKTVPQDLGDEEEDVVTLRDQYDAWMSAEEVFWEKKGQHDQKIRQEKERNL